MHLDATTRKPIAAYRKALDEVKNHVMTELKASVVITKEIVFGSANDLPLKEHSHQYKAKTLVDIMENVALDTVPWESIAACLANDRNAELPPHFRTDICADTSFVLQIASIKTATGSFGAVIKHFIFAQKTTSLRNIDEVVHGTGYLTDYSPSFRRGPCAFQILLERNACEAAIKECPDILDDPDTSVMSVTKLKVRTQLQVICDNRVNDDAEPDLLDSAGQIKFDFMDIIAPAFPDKSSKQAAYVRTPVRLGSDDAFPDFDEAHKFCCSSAPSDLARGCRQARLCERSHLPDYFIHRRILDEGGANVYLSLTAVGVFLKYRGMDDLWVDVQCCYGVVLDKKDCRVVGGKTEAVVMDEAIVGAHPEDGWSVGSKRINTAGAEQTRKPARTERSNLVSRVPGIDCQQERCMERRRPVARGGSF
ncbi:unnamed protein product [Symbiodinium microadriaticum]|nr:unnamed protein product [Symbiodinium microadriaticum]CAE7261167.1 USP31 [Symbiodinium sp. KB8]